MTESDFMVVECACRQMGQKVETSVQQKLLDVSPANYPCTVRTDLQVLYQKTISSAEKESARGLISDVDGKAGWCLCYRDRPIRCLLSHSSSW